jgi:hypothetical protein
MEAGQGRRLVHFMEEQSSYWNPLFLVMLLESAKNHVSSYYHRIGYDRVFKRGAKIRQHQRFKGSFSWTAPNDFFLASATCKTQQKRKFGHDQSSMIAFRSNCKAATIFGEHEQNHHIYAKTPGQCCIPGADL